jgi:hypothetical protein
MNQVSLAMFVIQGLVGPKPRPKGVGDGLLVNIPILLENRYQLWGERGGDSVDPIGRVPSNKLVQSGKSSWAFSATAE